MMDLSIIIVNWNSKEYLRKCIASILAMTHGIEYEIVVIDNASFDGCDEILRQYYPQVQFIQSDQNLGFARANNLAFEASSGRNILFINPDTEIKSSAIEILHKELTSLPYAGIVGAKLVSDDGSVLVNCIQVFPTILNQMLNIDLLRNCKPLSRLWGMRSLLYGSKIPKEVDVVSGACLMIKRSLFEKVGMFSDDYFMYSEDVDLCYKIKKSGSKVYYVPNAVVVHYGGASSSQSNVSNFSNVMLLESRWRYFRKTRSLSYCLLYRSMMFCVSVIRICLMLFVSLTQCKRKKPSSIDTVLMKWKGRLSWTLGGEKWVKKY